jgi:two-component system cell cycle response regulator
VDGGGYPDRLVGEEIPLGARIVAVCDAMTSDRPYRRAMSADAAVAELLRHARTQFDAEVVAAFQASWRSRRARARRSCTPPGSTAAS